MRTAWRLLAAAGLAVVAAPLWAADLGQTQTSAYSAYGIPPVSDAFVPRRVLPISGDGSAVLVSQLAVPDRPSSVVRSSVNALGAVSLNSVVTASDGAYDPEYYYLGTGASISYQFTVVGDEGYDGLVPILYTASLSASAPQSAAYSGNAQASAALRLGDGVNDLASYGVSACTGGCSGGQPFSLAISDTLSIGLGTIISVSESVSASVNGVASASAYADPYFYIDPAFLAAHPGFSLAFSPYVGNDLPAPSVPEPATWAMMIGGFGLVGAALRRRRGVAAALA